LLELITLTFYQHLTNVKEKIEDLKISMTSQARSTVKKKDGGRRKKVNQNKTCVSSQNKRMRKEEGATVDYLSSAILFPYLSQRAASCVFWAVPAAFYNELPTLGKSHKIPQMSYLRRETKRRRFLVI
jgi:hypothetical protein